ncbi:MAG: hypothetical protein DHS20C02_17290 [Micavibrio sp.]|nr:MAG: hypothetical protein DHS20C02_17290 [Micavibrio sp.]
MNRYHFIYVLLVAVVFLTFVCTAPAMAQNSCPKVEPKVFVKSLTKKTKKFRNRSAFNLTMLHNDNPRDIQGTTLGLHISPFHMTAEYRYAMTKMGRKTCVSLDEVRIKFYTQPVLLVASNFPPKSCEFKAVYKHEKGHDKILRSTQREYGKKTRAELKKFIKRFGGAGAVSEGRIEFIQNRIAEQIERKLDDIVLEAGNVLNNRQSAHDSAKEYSRVEAMCDGWDKRLNGQ